MSYHFADVTPRSGDLAAASAEALLEMHSAGWPASPISSSEAEAIFALEHANHPATAEWRDFFVETICDCVLNGSEPRGYVSDLDALWLIAQLEHGEDECSEAERELVLRVIERARNNAHTLKAFVLEAATRQVMAKPVPGVGERECRMIRRAIFADCHEQPRTVSRREAELLFHIKDACTDADNAPEWLWLFVHGVGRFMTGFASAQSYRAVAPMFELDCFIAENRASLGRFMGGMAQAAPNAFDTVFRHRVAEPGAQYPPHKLAAISEWKQGWLEVQIAASGQADAYDQALMAFIAEEVGFS